MGEVAVLEPEQDTAHAINLDENRLERPQVEPITVIVWCNDEAKLREYVIGSLTPHYQVADFQMQLIAVSPEAGYATMGQAYAAAQKRAMYATRVYIHQDVAIMSRDFVVKLHEMLDQPHIGAVGAVGTVVDTGGAYFHADLDDRRGVYYGVAYPERAKVQNLDGMLLCTREEIEWCGEYKTRHMVIEDACMQIRRMGLENWTIDAVFQHYTKGEPDEHYWNSLPLFQERHSDLFEGDKVRTPEELRKDTGTIKRYRQHITQEWVDAPWQETPDGKVRLNCGSGENPLLGFTNIDLDPPKWVSDPNAHLYDYKQIDLTEPLPYEDGTVEHITAHHFLEHLTYKKGLAFLKECYRVLRPGGLMTVLVPDFDFVARARLIDTQAFLDWAEYELYPNELGQVHSATYTSELLQEFCREAGFTVEAVPDREIPFAMNYASWQTGVKCIKSPKGAI